MTGASMLHTDWSSDSASGRRGTGANKFVSQWLLTKLTTQDSMTRCGRVILLQAELRASHAANTLAPTRRIRWQSFHALSAFLLMWILQYFNSQVCRHSDHSHKFPRRMWTLSRPGTSKSICPSLIPLSSGTTTAQQLSPSHRRCTI